MITIASKEAKNRFGEVLDHAQREPVAISKKGRAVAVVLSRQEYERLEQLEEQLLAIRADEALQRAEWLGADKSLQALRDIIDAQTESLVKKCLRF